MATISNTPRPGYAWDATDNVWYPIGTGTHTHPDYITQSTAINPSTITTKGDLIVGTGAGTFVRQGVGSDGQVLVADSAQADGVNWVTPTAGGMTLISTTAMSGSPFTLSSIPSTYKDLVFRFYNCTGTVDNQNVRMTFNGNTSSIYNSMGVWNNDGTVSSLQDYGASSFLFTRTTTATTGEYRGNGVLEIPDYTSSYNKRWQGWASVKTNANAQHGFFNNGTFGSTAAISSITFTLQSGTFNGGTILLYGVS
jgi:hypothetical protein